MNKYQECQVSSTGSHSRVQLELVIIVVLARLEKSRVLLKKKLRLVLRETDPRFPFKSNKKQVH